jgi:hypothetical protein
MAKELYNQGRKTFVREVPDAPAEEVKKIEKTAKLAAKKQQKPKDTNLKKETKKPAKAATPVIPDSELLDLTDDNVLAIIKQLGGKDVRSAQIVPYLKVVKEKTSQKKYPPTVRACKRLVKAGKLTMAEHGRFEEFKFSAVP